ncbi:hypothetical protein [Paenibacillus endoradicis]|uniref:hypothetical protein n=1 Tax=Paenibacillus endoradicis TaxID=2972487 RepID=UPI002158C5C7|nr:hypothetical protein [Paenibacillus endoradicis]MCR8658001.1 hypothetical protein [Paenibacillus endoradicis]
MKKIILSLLLIVLLSACGSETITAQSVEENLVKAGVDVANKETLGKDTMSLIGLTISEGVRYPLDEKDSVRVLVFESNKDAKTAKKALDELSESAPMLLTYTEIKGNILVQVTGGVEKSVAEKYLAVIK